MRGAITDFTMALQLNPGSAASYVSRGFAYFKVADYDRAITDYTAALHIDPREAKTYNNRGVAYRFKGQYDWQLRITTRQ